MDSDASFNSTVDVSGELNVYGSIGLFGADPISRQSAIASLGDTPSTDDIVDRINNILGALRALGLINS